MFRVRINGLKNRTASILLHRESTSIRQELSHAQQLELLRQAPLPEPLSRAAGQVARLDTAEGRRRFAEGMESTRAALAALSVLLQPPPHGSRHTAARFARRAKGSLGALIPSLTGTAPALRDAMTSPGAAVAPSRARSRAALLTRRTGATAEGGRLQQAAEAVRAAEELLYRAENDCAIVNEPREHAPPALRYLAEDNLRVARDLVGQARRHAAPASDAVASESTCKDLIAGLRGIDPNANAIVLSSLRHKFDSLFQHLTMQSDAQPALLDAPTAFSLLYRSIVTTLSPCSGDADPERVLAVLQELMHPITEVYRRIESGIAESSAGAQPTSPAVLDAQQVLYALAPLRRGTELFQRLQVWQADPASGQIRGLAPEEQALKVLLATASALSADAGATNDDTVQLLRTAQKAARQCYQGHGETLSPAERIAYSAVRNGFVEAGQASALRNAAGALDMIAHAWLPRAVQRSDRRAARWGNRGTPLQQEALALAARTSTAYGVDSTEAMAQIDRYVVTAACSAMSAIDVLASHLHPTERNTLLLHKAVLDIALERVPAQQIRPEHCTLDGTTAPPAVLCAKLRDSADALQIEIDEATLDALSSSPIGVDSPTLHQPLQAEHLIALKDMLRSMLQGAGLDERHPARDAVNAAIAEARLLEDLLDLSEPEIRSAEDVYRYLAVKLEQLQFRGKMRLTNGAVAGVNLKPVSYTVTGLSNLITGAQLSKSGLLAAMSVSPRLRAEWQSARGAIFEMSMSTIGCEIFIGHEHRISTATGLGIGVGTGSAWLRAQLAADKGRTTERTVRQGVILMIPRSLDKSYSDDAMRREARVLLDHVFRMTVDETGEIRVMDPGRLHGRDVGGVPSGLAEILLHCPHVSIAVIGDMRNHSKRTETAVSGAMRAGTGIAGMPGAGKKSTRTTRRMILTERTGTTTVERRHVLRAAARTWQAGISASATVLAGGSQPLAHAARLVMPGASRQKQTGIAGNDARLRLVSVDGRTDPINTRRNIEYVDVHAFLASIEANYEHWIRLGIAQLFKTGQFKQYAGLPFNEKRRIVEQHLARALEKLAALATTPDGTRVLHNVFTESYRMTDVAAKQYDALLDEQAVVEAAIDGLEPQRHNGADGAMSGNAQAREVERRRKDAEQERARLIDAQNALLRDEASWVPRELRAIERTLEMAQTGIDFFVKAGIVNMANGQRPIMTWPV